MKFEGTLRRGDPRFTGDLVTPFTITTPVPGEGLESEGGSPLFDEGGGTIEAEG